MPFIGLFAVHNSQVRHCFTDCRALQVVQSSPEVDELVRVTANGEKTGRRFQNNLPRLIFALAQGARSSLPQTCWFFS